MGLSGSKTKQTNEPSAYSKPYISAGANALQNTYNQTAPLASSISQTLAGQLPGLADQAFTPSAGITAATDYNTSVLNGDFLGSNPYLGKALADSSNDITDRVSAVFGKAGRTGSGANAYALGKGISSAQNSLLASEYDAERGRQSQAAALAPSLDASKYTGLGAYLTAAQGAVGIPQSTASGYAGGIGGLLGGYNTTTQASNPGLLGGLGSLVGLGADVAGLGGSLGLWKLK